MRSLGSVVTIAWAAALVFGGFPSRALAHCDALDGPVVTAARRALQERDVALVLPWVQSRDEGEVQKAFELALRVRSLGTEAQSLSDQWFFETVVRIHRAGEGAPFEGLKPSGMIPPTLSEADRALQTGKVDALTSDLTAAAAAGVREHFSHARDAKQTAEASVEAGRRYVTAYVEYIHYVEALQAAASGAPSAHESTPAGTHER